MLSTGDQNCLDKSLVCMHHSRKNKRILTCPHKANIDSKNEQTKRFSGHLPGKPSYRSDKLLLSIPRTYKKSLYFRETPYHIK